MAYLICFAASTVLAYFANKTSDRKKFWMLSAISILIPVLLAGLRDYEIGIDTISYMSKKRYWLGAASAESLGEYMEYYMGIGYGEPLFALLCGMIGQTFGNYSVFLFVVHAIIITGVYIGAYRFRKEVNPAMVLLLFYLVFYNHSLNIMRQYMAMAIVFAALADIPQKKYIRYSIAVVIAMMFHTSALLGFGAIVIHWYLYCDWKGCVGKVKRAGKRIGHVLLPNRKTERKIKNQRLAKFTAFIRKLFDNCKNAYNAVCTQVEKIEPVVRRRQVILFSAMLLLVLLANPLCRLVIRMGFLHEKYLWYLDMSKAEHTTLITLFLLLEMSVLLLWHKYLRKSSRLFDFFFANTGTYLILHQISSFIVYGKRVAAYFALANLVTIAMIPRMYKDKKRRVIVYVLVLCVVIFYWFYTYILRNASQTYPYALVFFGGE